MSEAVPYPELETKDSLNVLIVDGGMRGSALEWLIAKSERAGNIYTTSFNEQLPVTELNRIARFALDAEVDLALVTQDNAIDCGVTDRLRNARVATCGTSQAGSRLETSKRWMKKICHEAGLPTASYGEFTSRRAAHNFVDELGEIMVVKDDYLARGKASVVCRSNTDGHQAVEDMFDGKFSNRGKVILVESFSEGRERSGHISISDLDYDIWLPGEDHKQLRAGDEGPMTGGMGVIVPPSWLDLTWAYQQDEATVKALLSYLSREHTISFPGYKGTHLLEVNQRPGSPEMEAYAPLITSDFLEHCVGIVNKQLKRNRLQWEADTFGISLVGAAEGYPDSTAVRSGELITGIEHAQAMDGIEIFLGSVAMEDGKLFSVGASRLFAIAAKGATPRQALDRGLEAMHEIRVGGKIPVHRNDIGMRTT